MKPKKKKQKKAKADPLAKASGPSNAEEASQMRNVLGFTASQPATATAAATAVDPNASIAVPSATLPTAAPQVAQPATTPAAVSAPAQQAQHAQQPQQPQLAQQAQQPQLAQQPQQAQQGTFKFGFSSAERPAEAAPAAVQEATQPAGAETLPGPPEASENTESFVARRVFVGGMPFSYEVHSFLQKKFCVLSCDLL